MDVSCGMRHLLFAAMLMLSACGGSPSSTDAHRPPAQDPLERDLRAVGAASAVGYDGALLEQDVRQTVEAQQQRNAEAAEAARQAGE